MQRTCLACDLAEGRRPLPGGLIFAADAWRVEHCVGPFGVGTLIVKPQRHVESLAGLTREESKSLGPLLRLTANVVQRVTDAQQVYACLWSHGPVHIHFVVQPEIKDVVAKLGTWGPMLQAAMAQNGSRPSAKAVEDVATRARHEFKALTKNTDTGEGGL